jgi:large subunit ribosomal protein L15
MPLSQRLPKLPGFKNPFKKVYALVNLSKLSRFADGSKVDAEALLAAGLIRGGEQIKILGAGRMKRRLTVEAHAFSNSARESIEKAGGTATIIGKEPEPEEKAAPAE